MEELPAEWVTSFERRLDQAKVPQPYRPSYRTWVKFYLLFCQKFGYPATALGPFLTKLADKKYSVDDRHHAATTVRLLLRYDPQDQKLYLQLSSPCSSPAPEAIGSPSGPIPARQPPVCLPRQSASWERELGDLETEVKLRNYSPKTFSIYRFWVTRFQAFVRSRPTAQLSNQ